MSIDIVSSVEVGTSGGTVMCPVIESAGTMAVAAGEYDPELVL